MARDANSIALASHFFWEHEFAGVGSRILAVARKRQQVLRASRC